MTEIEQLRAENRALKTRCHALQIGLKFWSDRVREYERQFGDINSSAEAGV